MRARVITVGVALCVACKGSEREVPKPPAKLAGVRVVDLIPVSLSGESWQDAEPFLALYASNPRPAAPVPRPPGPPGRAAARPAVGTRLHWRRERVQTSARPGTRNTP